MFIERLGYQRAYKGQGSLAAKRGGLIGLAHSTFEGDMTSRQNA